MRWYVALGLIVTVLRPVTSDLDEKDVEKWSWGFVPGSNENLGISGSNISLESRQDPCRPYEPPTMPDFNAMAKRISEKKCYEYIWQMKLRDGAATHQKNCTFRGPFLFVIGGDPAFPGEYPHMGAIGWKAVVGAWIFKCGSSLISDKFVLTAAHCSSASPRDDTIGDITPKIVRFGLTIATNIQNMGVQEAKDYDIDKIFVHPLYASPKKYYDIALLKLTTEVIFTKLIQPACLWSHFNLRGKKAEVAGWGAFQSGGIETSPKLLAAEVDLINSEKCEPLLRSSCNRNWCGIRDHQLCAGKLVGGVDACQGDSGGPLMVKIPLPLSSEGNMSYLIGVTSFGVRCGLSNLPGVYTRVSSFLDWIENIVWS